MKNELESLLRRNRGWAERIEREDPGFFERLSKQQAPKYLWIGCSDSRVPANQVIDMAPGEVFVHRNIANVMVHTDLNCMSVIQFAVDVLKVRHILVVGHYGCGGVGAALHGTRVGLADNWIRHVGDVAQKHAALMERVPQAERHDVLCELNVIEQAENVGLTTVIRDAWARGQDLAIHGWVYSLADGLVRDLGMDVYAPDALTPVYAQALQQLRERHGIAT
ncbi:carbonate dehydratase [Cognatiluteimonas weifangensis]|uniref:Carbonic anhydrase n=1 Tax=Cognatiluteimonas weifangensis TaxID=2303539 RepID=A0A372DPB3_9GAMM|nr:carbonate dehydratase [Luteimonas weifangensis]RFP61277.1 carbonate dehydratase [Luteimonas weifangensis]